MPHVPAQLQEYNRLQGAPSQREPWDYCPRIIYGSRTKNLRYSPKNLYRHQRFTQGFVDETKNKHELLCQDSKHGKQAFWCDTILHALPESTSVLKMLFLIGLVILTCCLMQPLLAQQCNCEFSVFYEYADIFKLPCQACLVRLCLSCHNRVQPYRVAALN